MKIYHGSKQIIESPIVKGSNPTNDYGPAFYMTVDLDAAKSWACKNNSKGIVNNYSIRSDRFNNLKILDLTKKDQYSVLNWMAILMHFRKLDSTFVINNKLVLDWLAKYYIDVDEYDVVIGFRADDAYFRFPTRFISNDLAIEDLEDIFLSGNLGIQYAFISEKALRLLKFQGISECEDEYMGHYFNVVSKATYEFDELVNRPRDPKKHYILDLMRD